MSRCFPFPPPGYEKKARIEDLDLLKKEKHKKKRGKEKRDDKEKRKRKNRDKKDEGKDRVRDRASTLGETRLPEKSKGHHRELLDQKDHKDKGNRISTEKKYAGQFSDYIGGRFKYRNRLPDATTDFKIVPELGKGIKDGDGGSKSLLGEKFSVHLPYGDDLVGGMVAKVTQNFNEGKAKDENKDGAEDKSGYRKMQNEFGGSATIHVRVKDRVDSVEKNADKRMEGKRREGNGSEEKSKDKQTDKDGKQEGNGKDKDRDKKKKKEEKIEQKTGNLEKSKYSNKKNNTSTDSILTSELHRDGHKPVAKVGSPMKRKDFETNGILHAEDHMSSNFPKFSSSYDLPSENGKILKPCQSSIPAASNWQVTANNLKLEDKEHKFNGIVEILPALLSAKSIQADQIATVHSKPPHPDFKYLSQVYFVPKMEEWSVFCDQDWLYSSHTSRLKKLKVHGLEMEMMPHVWAEAMQIKSSDICALPYVVPY